MMRCLEEVTSEGRLKEGGLFLLERTGRGAGLRGQGLHLSICKQLLEIE